MTLIVEKPHDLLGMVGTKMGPTGWVAVEQDRVDAFAECTGDDQWIHVDVDRAKAGPFGGTIAHGYLTLSMVNLFLPELVEVRGFAHAVNVGLDKLPFLAPVVVGSRIRAVSEIESGILWINAPLLDNDALPFGGRKLSGTGRQLGPEGLAQFQNTKFVMIDPKASNQDFWWFPYKNEEMFKQK